MSEGELRLYKDLVNAESVSHIDFKLIAKKLFDELKQKENIINELERKLYSDWLEWKDSDCDIIYERAYEDKVIYDYIQQLKGSDK